MISSGVLHNLFPGPLPWPPLHRIIHKIPTWTLHPGNMLKPRTHPINRIARASIWARAFLRRTRVTSMPFRTLRLCLWIGSRVGCSPSAGWTACL